MEKFQNTLEEYQLNDVGFTGNWFTWERGNLPERNIQERLDRGVANEKWLLMFSEAKIQHLVHSFSDHYPLLVVTRREEERQKGNSFKFKAWWTLEDSFVDEVKKLWGIAAGDFLQKLKFVSKGLKKWARKIQMNRKRKKEFLTAKLLELIEAERDDTNLAEIIDMKIQLNFEIEKDEYYWEQRARLNCLKFGDRNAAYFHSQATQRRMRNQIIKLQNEEGRDTEDVKEMESIARAYFQNLFTAGNTTIYEQLIMGIDRYVYKEDNRKLIAPYTGEEVREALFRMGSTKAPGEDGFPALFNQKCWTRSCTK
ncbi:hypothetical protein PVK06_028860 [Gossypium arboreum]|uniref:Reverse transcriptase n=1 Tax=Gossypium arboreum TaxID=29729 RepID=A0ABR0P522_GOSAR|nr:hypothetical protein PVK06_028860 [Gossypium arboreum]